MSGMGFSGNRGQAEHGFVADGPAFRKDVEKAAFPVHLGHHMGHDPVIAFLGCAVLQGQLVLKSTWKKMARDVIGERDVCS